MMSSSISFIPTPIFFLPTNTQRYNVGQVGTDDYSFIGAAVGALLSPAIFLRRAPMPTLVLGGAAIGIGAGVWTHIVQTLMKGEDVSPDAMVRTCDAHSIAHPCRFDWTLRAITAQPQVPMLTPGLRASRIEVVIRIGIITVLWITRYAQVLNRQSLDLWLLTYYSHKLYP